MKTALVNLMAILLTPLAVLGAAEPPAFPYGLPDQKPDRPLSAAMERLYKEYPAVTPEKNELFSNFKFTQLEGFDYHDHDGTVSRRDPSKVIHNGIEHNTIQYAPDGVSFKIAAISSLMPVAAGPYVPDAFTNTRDGRGITWGLCHITDVGERDRRHSILARFDCDLSQDVNDPVMKQTDLYLKPEAYFSQGLSKKQRERIENEARQTKKP